VSTPTIDRVVIPDDLPKETLHELQKQIDEQLEGGSTKTKKAPKVLTQKQAQKKLKKLEKLEREAKRTRKAKKAKALKDAKAAVKKSKAKGKKSKGKKRKGLKKVTHAVIVVPTRATGKALKKGGKAVARYGRKAGRWTKNAGRKMWTYAVAAGKWTWGKAKWAGRLIAGAAAWVTAAGGKVIGFVVSAIGTTWALVALGGLTVLALIAWGANTSTEAVVAPLSWLAEGRPGSLKKYKAKRKADSKRKANRDAARDKAKKRIQAAKREVRKANREWERTHAKLIRKGEELARQLDEAIEEAEVAQEITEEAQLLAMATEKRFDEMTLEDMQVAVAMREAELLVDENRSKEEYSFYSAMNRGLTAILPPLNDARRGKQLYDVLWKACLTEQSGETDTAKQNARAKEFDRTKFQAGITEVTKQSLRVQNELANSAESGESVQV
jgi:hypothetical protein